MLHAAADEFPQIRETFTEASDALGEDLWALVASGQEDELNLTENTQPAMLTASVALWRCWRDAGGAEPSGMAGHSLGELTALCCAGAIAFADAVRLVRARGRFMQHAVPAGEGAMTAVLGLDSEQVAAICREVSDEERGLVAAVNFNSPQQVVIAGHTEAVGRAAAQLQAAGARRILPLPVSAPFHTALMRPAGERLRDVLDDIEIRAPAVPVIHNVTGASESDPVRIRELLVQQVAAPVRWTDCVLALRQAGARMFLECGPGKVLGGLLRRIDKALICHYLEAPPDLRRALTVCAGGAA